MKYNKYIAVLVIVAGGFIAGCDKDTIDPPTPEALKTELLAGESSKTWGLASGSAVTLDGDDRSGDWAGFELTLTASKGYSTSTSFDDNVWPSAGTWDYQGTTGSGLDVIVRSDGIRVNIDNASASGFTMSFDYILSKPLKNGRVESIEGNWIFKMVAN